MRFEMFATLVLSSALAMSSFIILAVVVVAVWLLVTIVRGIR
jgi:hypothetical protein